MACPCKCHVKGEPSSPKTGTCIATATATGTQNSPITILPTVPSGTLESPILVPDSTSPTCNTAASVVTTQMASKPVALSVQPTASLLPSMLLPAPPNSVLAVKEEQMETDGGVLAVKDVLPLPKVGMGINGHVSGVLEAVPLQPKVGVETKDRACAMNEEEGSMGVVMDEGTVVQVAAVSIKKETEKEDSDFKPFKKRYRQPATAMAGPVSPNRSAYYPGPRVHVQQWLSNWSWQFEFCLNMKNVLACVSVNILCH